MARRPAIPGVDRRQQILEAALDVFAEHGFEGATTKEIATHADVTQGLIYFYFPSKEDLFFAAYEHQAKLALDQLHFLTAESDEPPEVVIRRAVTQFVETMDSPRSLCLMRIMLRVTAHAEDRARCGEPLDVGRERMRARAAAITQAFAQYLDAQVARGTVRPVNTSLAAQLFVHSMMIAVMRRASGDESLAHLSRQELADHIVGIFLHGLLPDRDGPAWRRHANSGARATM
jgi:AcrR family transcriptional regulator